MFEVLGTWWPSMMSHSVEAREVLSIDGPRCTLDLVEQGPEDALQAVAFFDHGRARSLVPSEGIGETTLLGKDLLL